MAASDISKNKDLKQVPFTRKSPDQIRKRKIDGEVNKILSSKLTSESSPAKAVRKEKAKARARKVIRKGDDFSHGFN